MRIQLKSMLQILLLISLPICSSICIDMYLPAYQKIAASLHIPTGFMNLSMSAYLIGIAISQLFYGPISDRFGRKKTLLPGLAVFCAASVVCAFSINFWMFLSGRLLQALGAGAASVLCRAMIADRYTYPKRTQILAYVSVVNIISPIFAPLLGGIISFYFNWHWIFIALSLYSLFIVICIYLFIEETLVEKNIDALRWNVLSKNLHRVLTDRLFSRLTLIIALCFFIVFTWIMLSPALLIQHFQIAATNFSQYFMLPALGSCMGAFITSRFSNRYAADKLIFTGLLIFLAGALMLLIFKDYLQHPIYLTLIIGIIFFGNGFTIPQLISTAIGQFPEINGFASSIIGFAQTSTGAVLGILLSYVYHISINAIDILMLLPALGSFMLFITIRSRQLYHQKNYTKHT